MDAMPSAPGGFGLVSMLRRGAVVFADRPALRGDGVGLSHRELYDVVEARARGLVGQGLGQGDRVGILMGNRPEWLECLFAVIAAGGVAVPLSYYSTPAELAAIAEEAPLALLYTESRYAEQAREAAGAVRVELVDGGRVRGSAPRPAGTPAGPCLPETDPADVALAQYTSGTSARPKAVLHSQHTIMWNALCQLGDLAIAADAVTLVVPSFAWSAGLHDLTLATLWAGGEVVVYPSRGLDPERLVARLAAERVSHVFLSPSVMRRIVAAGARAPGPLDALRVVLTGGEPIADHLVRELVGLLGPVPVWRSYGLSEFPSTMTLLGPGEAVARPVSVGRATSLAEIRVVDEDDVPVPPGTLGELVCRSPATMLGYDREPEATARALRGGWLHTGDLAVLDEEGYVSVVGRAKDMVISGGLNVYAHDVEAALAEHDLVGEVAVVGLADDEWGQIVCAHVVPAGGVPPSVAELDAFLAPRLAAYKRPRRYVFRESPLPRNQAGKVLKQRLDPPPPNLA
jgi:fatty-acyl-CoA synthase